MLGVGSFTPSCNSSSALTTIPHNLTTFSLVIPNKINSLSASLYSNACSNHLFLQGRTGFSVSASKKRRKSNNSLLEMDGVDDGDEDEDEDEEEEEEEDGRFIPFESMRRWLQNKPLGFGEGKEYDISIEDKLLEEMEQSRTAQLANINKLKNNPPKATPKKEQQLQKAPEVVPSGIRVRVENLPKKKNVHRDLQLAFKGFPGIVNVSPAVSGNKKTRDPVCKGFAFLDFGSEEAANRFVQIYSRQSITFGKIQKQITCEITNPCQSSDSVSEHSAEGTYMSTPELRLASMEEDPDMDSNMDDLSLDSLEVSSPEKSTGPDDQSISVNWEDIGEGIEQFNLLEPDDNENLRPRMVAKTDSLSLKKQQKSRKVQKKIIVKGKSEKVPKLNIPGSAKRLRIKEKAVLTGVLSKYGAKASPASSGKGS